MKNDSLSEMRSPQLHSQTPMPLPRRVATQNPQSGVQPKTVLTPAQWVRAVSGVDTPFGHDRLPTVFD